MKGSSLVLPGLAQPVQIHPKQQAPRFSASTTLASQFQSCRRFRQYTVRLQRQEVPGLDNELRIEFLGVKHFPSSSHGDGKALKQRIPLSKENFKNSLIKGPKRNVDVQGFDRPFDESHRPREKEGQFTPISERRVTHHGSRDSYRDTLQGNGTICIGGSVGQTIAVLQNRLQRGVTTDSGTFVKVLRTCLKHKDLLAAKQIHDCIIQSGMDKNSYVAVTLLNVYIKCGALADARQVFDLLEKKTVVTWTNMIAGYTQSSHAPPALEIFNQMRQQGVKPDEITY